MSELARRGYVDGRNLTLDTRVAANANPRQLATLAAELVRTQPDLILTAGGSDVALAAKAATSTLPIVFLASADPVGLGLVASLARPGGNVTGNSSQNFEAYAKSLQLLVQLISGRRRIVAIDPTGEGLKRYFPKYAASLIAAADGLGVELRFVEYGSIDGIEPLVKRLLREGMDAAFFGSGPLHEAAENRRIADIMIANRLPTVGNAHAGMMLEYTASFKARARTAAAYVDRIVNGARPGDLPVPQPNEFALTINMKTAEGLGLVIPESILLRADEVIR